MKIKTLIDTLKTYDENTTLELADEDGVWVLQVNSVPSIQLIRKPKND